MNRARAVNRINELLSRFVAEVKAANASGLYDLNIHAENVVIPMLNRLYGLALVNANSKEKNFPAVDLIDEKNRVAFQVSATADSEKIKHTLREFIRHKLYERFDLLNIYIISDKQKSYSGKGFEEIIDGEFRFDKDAHIIDYSDIAQKVSSTLETGVIEDIYNLLEREFTEAKIEERKNKLENPEDEPELEEQIFPNLLELEFPERIFIAEVSFDRKEVIKQNRQTKNTLWWKSSQRKIASRILNETSEDYYHDWHLYENKLITFRNLNANSEPLRILIDAGTIEELDTCDYFEINEDYKRAFKSLLGFCLREKLSRKGVEWVHEEKLFRFKTNYQAPNAKKVRWRKENNSTKTVIKEIMNKKEGHIICFGHLAFHYSLYDFDNRWFLSISPTWSFTSNGRDRSRFAQTYKSGIKRLEGNKSVYYYFRFWAYFLSHYDLFDQPYLYFRTKPAFSFIFSPGIKDDGWKSEIEETDDSLEQLADNELTSTLFE